MTTQRRVDKMTGVLSRRQPDLTLVCENIHDPHNVGAILRSADAVGIQDIHLLYTSRVFPKLAKKSSASAAKWIERHEFSSAAELRIHLKKNGYTIYATHLEANPVSIFDVDWTQPAAIILGNEHEGVSGECLDIADKRVAVPMFGMIQSLNVSVAAAVILYEACRQRQLKGMYPNPHTTADQIAAKLALWKEK